MTSTLPSSPTSTAGMHTYLRSSDAGRPESPYEKPVILPKPEDHDPGRHAWADARFATDIMAEHALFFALLMPKELAAAERAEALRSRTYSVSCSSGSMAHPRPNAATSSRLSGRLSKRSSRSLITRHGLARPNATADCAVWCGHCSSTTPSMRRSVGRGGWSCLAMANQSWSDRKSQLFGPTSWMSTHGSLRTCWTPTSTS